MAARSGESRLNPAAPEFFPTRRANPTFRHLCPLPPQPLLLLPSPPLPPPPPPLHIHRPPSYWQRPSGTYPTRRPEFFRNSQRARGGYSRWISAGARNRPPRPPRMRVLSWRPKPTAMTESEESSADDPAVYSRIVEHRAFHRTGFRMERRKMPLEPGQSTVMICNIPNKYTRKMLMEFLDEHCAKENKKLLDNPKGSISRGDGDDADQEGSNNGVISAYDFIYLPFDLSRKMNLGYAFVNFTHPGAVQKFKSACHNKKWEHCSSRKICELAAASMQGKEELMKHFETTAFACDEEEFLPLSFSPPGRGSGMSISHRTVGTLINSRTSSNLPT